jgi:hypothetical protein
MKIEPLNGHAILLCEFCREPIAQFKPEDLKMPITSLMFKSVDPHHKFPLPFPMLEDRPETIAWEAARCPFCRLRPFNERDKVKTKHGYFTVGDTSIPVARTHWDDNQERIEIEWGQFHEDALTQTEKNQKEIDKEFEVWSCKYCGDELESKGKLAAHIRWQHKSNKSKEQIR